MSAALKELLRREPPLSLAVAESLTCGRLQAKVGEIAGASTFFAGGITAYGLDQKVRHLGVRRAAARRVNCVSAAVAEEMARGACRLFGADVAAATTGYAEPSPENGVRRPFAWVALAHRQSGRRFAVRSFRVECRGASRTAAQKKVAEAAFAALVRWVAGIRAGPGRAIRARGVAPGS